MRLQIRFRNEAAGLPIDSEERSGNKRGMQWDGQGLPVTGRQRSSHLAMTAACRHDLEPELHKSRGNGASG
jgi:YD repeat-containing protein